MSLEQYRGQCLEKLQWALGLLEIQADAGRLEPVAELIVQTMTGPWRYFHTPDHIFEVGGTDDPIEVLAALFHDIVYVQVDRGIHFNLAVYLTPYIEQDDERLRIREASDLPADDEGLALILDLFNFAPGQVLSPFGGQNELLSAMVAVKVMRPWLSLRLLAQVVACIEATIPFRRVNDQGLTSSEALCARLRTASQRFRLGLGEPEILEAVIRSVRLANRDVGGFGDTSACFLDNTWSLLPETNPHFKNPHSYTAREYRTSLQKTAGFLESLVPSIIFRRFHGEPDEATYNALVARADHNLAVGRLYLWTKLVTMALLEAISHRLGPDVPLTLLLGQLPTAGAPSGRLADLLPPPSRPRSPEGAVEDEVFDLLDKGRSRESTYDLRNSPMSVFLVHAIGFDGIRRELPRAQAFFAGTLAAEAYLKDGPQAAIDILVQGIAELFVRRKQAVTCAGCT
ncbi:hypothetical protein [Chondromyces crocatus]|uniref:Uncharacterized protein n=1 Tax=Chondromyces crocatus TaxID=52 RepID=A0A0K1E9H5_CHOCO|nr:hypothetical protein [Chondromyces crocatus]AKT37520.1 uncharacterized protein CMC5_016610 [Chondromyces crocatus]